MSFIIIGVVLSVAITVAVIVKKHKANNIRRFRSDGLTSTSNERTRLNGRGANTLETEVMEYFANTRHNQKDNWFRFKYKKVGDEWRAYIIRMPSLNGKSGDLHSTHRYTDGRGIYWVCREPRTRTLHDAQVVSRVWADRLLEYTVTGVEANSQVW